MPFQFTMAMIKKWLSLLFEGKYFFLPKDTVNARNNKMYKLKQIVTVISWNLIF